MSGKPIVGQAHKSGLTPDGTNPALFKPYIMPSDKILTYDFETGEPIELTVQEAIDKRNRYKQESFELSVYVDDLTKLIDKNQASVAHKLRGNANSSLQ